MHQKNIKNIKKKKNKINNQNKTKTKQTKTNKHTMTHIKKKTIEIGSLSCEQSLNTNNNNNQNGDNDPNCNNTGFNYNLNYNNNNMSDNFNFNFNFNFKFGNRIVDSSTFAEDEKECKMKFEKGLKRLKEFKPEIPAEYLRWIEIQKYCLNLDEVIQVITKLVKPTQTIWKQKLKQANAIIKVSYDSVKAKCQSPNSDTQNIFLDVKSDLTAPYKLIQINSVKLLNSFFFYFDYWLN